MLQRFTMVALLTVGLAGLAAAKTYSFTTYDTAKVGSVQLKPGDYKIKVEGTNVKVTDSEGKVIAAKATLQPANRKYEQTAVAMKKDGKTNEIQWVELGGTRDKLVFQQ